ncbi:polysaccharide pyruvyl transferase CsaB [Proteiniborus ethanoligenes]|uniref:Polysaccharide pyruvyl transferase CsaB n=1 Tax=Proteiniborus ethanoligenes TaxID=415015 RepID=A0A1H3SEV9_9FIRM|nr:polysaccharide pyruvyl transferase CsaB [Proteiniborus ethanoligenes]SDZ36613.1 polysaccharide pyruvyl transferase CsaB [Proteiniborus ethanoligenes]
MGKSVIISGYYGFDNSGDDAILKAIVKDLRKMNSNLNISAFSNNPQSTEEVYGIKAVNRINIWEVFKGIYSSDMLISGGGSLLQDITSTRSILYYLSLINIAKLLKKPVVIYANGIGPINKKINKILTRKALNNVDLITLRDYNSKNTLEEIGVKGKIVVTSDPVFTLEPSSREIIDKIFEEEGIPKDNQIIGISVRNWKNSKNLVDVVSKAIEYIDSTYDVKTVLIPMHYPEDLDISMEIAQKSNSPNCYVIKNKYSVEDMMGIIDRFELIIAMRLHSLIYAAAQAVPMIGLVYDPKVDGLLEVLEVYAKCDAENVELIELCSLIDKTWKERASIKKSLNIKKEELREKALDNVKMTLDVLKSR